MDNNKKQQQNFTRSKACQSADSINRKSSSDSQISKPWPRNTRRREQPCAARNDPQRNAKQYPSVKSRPNVDKRPRPRGGGGGNGTNGNGNVYDGDGAACEPDDFSVASAGLAGTEEAYGASSAVAKEVNSRDYELNSVYAPGSKKQNLNHLLNFHIAPRQSDYAVGLNVFGRNHNATGMSGNGHRYNKGNANGKKHKYNKEQFLQANFQFVIKANTKLQLNASPDTLIDWNSIEQINIQTTEEPQCPICLYPPIAAKLTRCGHAYCWPCILHYLALSDKTWRKCPICYEAIHTADLKSTTIMQQSPIRVGDQITFQLMRRKKGSMFIEKFNFNEPNIERYPYMTSQNERKLFSKFLLAKRADILEIIERERRELIADVDPTCPEYVFIQQALDLLKERKEKVINITKEDFKVEDYEEEGEIRAKEEKQEIKGEDKINMEEKGDFKIDINTLVEGITNIPLANVSANATASEVTEMSPTVITPEAASVNMAKYYYFYQSVDGQNIFLHPLNVKMLQACYGTLDRAPLIINARILQQEHHSMDEDHRRKFTCLGHLPLTCQFSVVEVDLQPPIISGGILKLFKEDLLFRKKERQRRDREERKRERQINEINDRQMGKLIASTANINISSSQEFPICGFEEDLPPVEGSIGSFDFEVEHPPAPAPPEKSPAVAAPKRQATYSAVAVVGESPTMEVYWPTLASPSANNTGNMYQALSTWGNKPNSTSSGAATTQQRTISDRSSECESINDVNVDIEATLSPMRTDLGDVLAMAISQKKQNNSTSAANAVGGGNKKNKKAKKMLPLFSTGINYNGK